VIQRGCDFIKHLIKGAKDVYQDEPLDVLVVTHGGFIQLLLKSVCGVKGVNIVNNTSFSIVDVFDANGRGSPSFVPVVINETSHLQQGNALMSASEW
jgi:broad specificity phosphatase PhoE